MLADEVPTELAPIVNVNYTAGGATEGLTVGLRVGLNVGSFAIAIILTVGIVLFSVTVVIALSASFNIFNSGESRLSLLKDTPQTDVWLDVTSDTSVADTPIALLTANPIMSLTTG